MRDKRTFLLETVRFLDLIYGETRESFERVTISVGTKGHLVSRHFDIADRVNVEQALLAATAANEQGYGVHLNIATRHQGLDRFHRGTRADLVSLPCIFADVDAPTADTRVRMGRCQPSIIVDSGRGQHYYWLLTTPTGDMDRAERLLIGIATALHGCRMEPTHMLRLPNTLNYKYDPPGMCRITVETDTRYRLDEIEAAFPAPPMPPPPARRTEHLHSETRADSVLDIGPTVALIVDELMDHYRGLDRGGVIKSLCPCPHQHDSPGEHFNFSPRYGIGICHGKHGKFTLAELCAALGIHPIVRD